MNIMSIGPLASLFVAAALVAAGGGCSSEGAGAGGPAPSSPSAAAAATQQVTKINLIASSSVLANDGSTPVDLTAIVTSDSGVAIADKTVAFSVNDANQGTRLEITQALTDASGVATARLLLNGNSTPRTVTVLAAVDQKTPSELPIQVAVPTAGGGGGISNNSRGELTVRIGTDNRIEPLDEQLSYRKRYAVIVSDNAGIPKAQATVLATLRARKYLIGYWTICPPNDPLRPCGTKWEQVVLSPGDGIDSEDTANFGVCNAGEDVNGDKVLTPGNVASYTVSSQTDSNGLAVINVVYPKSFAEWVVANLEVTVQVGGSESYNSLTIPLPMLLGDVQGDAAPPSIIRTRSSLSTVQMPFPLVGGEPVGSLNSLVAGSPFPYASQTPTCP